MTFLRVPLAFLKKGNVVLCNQDGVILDDKGNAKMRVAESFENRPERKLKPGKPNYDN